MKHDKQRAAWIEAKRKIMRQEPTFITPKEAIAAAVKLLKREQFSFPSVWKEPKDIGKKYAVVHTKNRENALISGYTEAVGEQDIHDIATGNRRNQRFDEVEEV